MGLIVDTTFPIQAERSGINAKMALLQMRRVFGNDEIAISVVTLIELAHGVARANTPMRAETRRRFVEELRDLVPVHPVSEAIALRAGLLDGLMAADGVHVALSDLLIGATALELGYRVATHNAQHFNLIPGLGTIAF